MFNVYPVYLGPSCFLFDVYMSHCRTAGNDISIFLDVQHVEFLTIKLTLTLTLKVQLNNEVKVEIIGAFHIVSCDNLEWCAMTNQCD